MSANNNATLLNRCRVVENTVKNISQKYADLPDKKIEDELGRLVNRACEYEHGTFIVLVVGPAKSGKSTLVNLISNAYVSPTSFLECTVRPSVISRRKGDHSSLTVYTSTNTGNRIEQIDSIIDAIRGFGGDDGLAGVLSEELELTEDNIRRHVELGLEKSLDSENLLTSIRTPGGRLLQERVFIIDMPGFDGRYQNIDNPVYETIAQRADLIIFVQSSNAAFSKVSGEFLDILAQNNQNVPVCLVHNIFDAAWWRDEGRKKSDIEEQRRFACNEIRHKNFVINDSHSFCINLGAVEDYRKGISDDRGILASYAAEYETMEQEMYDRIISNRDDMRLTNSLARVGQQRDKIISKAQARIAELDSLLAAYDGERRRLAQLTDHLDIASPTLPQPKLSVMVDAITLECKSRANGISLNIKKSNSEAAGLVADLVSGINDTLNASRTEIFRLEDVADDIYREYRQHLSELESAVLSTPGAYRATYLQKEPVIVDEHFDVAAHVDVSNIVPKKKIIGLFNGTHGGEELIQYIGVVREQLAPTPEHGQITDNGILARTDVTKISSAADRAVKMVTDRYNLALHLYYEQVSSAILGHILADPEASRSELAQLTELVADLKKLSL